MSRIGSRLRGNDRNFAGMAEVSLEWQKVRETKGTGITKSMVAWLKMFFIFNQENPGCRSALTRATRATGKVSYFTCFFNIKSAAFSWKRCAASIYSITVFTFFQRPCRIIAGKVAPSRLALVAKPRRRLWLL